MATNFGLCFQITAALLCCTVCTTEISCRNEAGEPVDWWVDDSNIIFIYAVLVFTAFIVQVLWQTVCDLHYVYFVYFLHVSCFFRFIIYKLPRYRVGAVGSGVEYFYLDASVGSWQISKFMVNSSQGAITNTLNQLYKGKAYMVRLHPCSEPSIIRHEKMK